MWVIFKRKHFCGFDSLFCGHCLGRNVSHFGLLHLHLKKKGEKKKVGDTEGFSDGYKLAGGPQPESCWPTGTPGLLVTSCVGTRGLPALELGAGCPAFPPPPSQGLSQRWSLCSAPTPEGAQDGICLLPPPRVGGRQCPSHANLGAGNGQDEQETVEISQRTAVRQALKV